MPEEKKEQETEELKKKLEECEKKAAEYLSGWQRARADFLNYKKEEMERIEQLLKYGEEEFILRMLPILDNFDLAEKKLPEKLRNDESVKGFLQIKAQILDFLKSQGVEEIKVAGERFDPNLHEAIEQVVTEVIGSMD
jgi:molecular chaperone GrpE